MDFDNLHQLLKLLYNEMLPVCGELIGIAKAIAGIGALFYIAYRVWQSLARAEPIDVFPLLRPFAIGICIIFFQPLVLNTLNQVLSPIVTGCHTLMTREQVSVNEIKEKRDRMEREAYLRDPGYAYLIDDDAFDQKLNELGVFEFGQKMGMYAEWAVYTLEKKIQNAAKRLLELFYSAAALVIDVLRTFFLVVLAILGPIAFAFSVYDGLQSSLTQWLTRYIGIYLWLPISDLFSTIMSKVHLMILNNDIQRLSNPDFIPDSSSSVYIIFMIIGIFGYFSIPTVSSWIIQSGGGGNYSRAINTVVTKVGGMGAAATGAAMGGALARAPKVMKGTYNGVKSMVGKASDYIKGQK